MNTSNAILMIDQSIAVVELDATVSPSSLDNRSEPSSPTALPLSSPFPSTLFLITTAMTIAVSSTPRERTFSKMKLEISFVQLIDDFADLHQNSRILVK